MKLYTSLALTMLVSCFAVSQSRTEVIAPMSGIGKGKVAFKVRDGGGELQAEGERLRRNTTYILNVGGGRFVRTVTTDGFGTYRLSVRFARGNAPAIVAGTRAVLLDGARNTVQRGVFANKR
ncbi:MAG: hypothetical protein JNM34_03910 [Chthonomonadaceae bacterium]|nr:hypothetical protein [Chthonomonadaceae bacterium]